MPLDDPKPLKKYSLDWPVGFTLSLAAAMGVAAGITGIMMPTADALPAGFFQIINFAPGFPAVAMDVRSTNDKVTGFVEMNPPAAKDSQLWKERFPATGTLDVIKLENKDTGQCLAWDDEGDQRLVIRPCSLKNTLWRKSFQGSATKLTLQAVGDPHEQCAAAFLGFGPNRLGEIFGCDFDSAIWEVGEHIGVIQIPLNPNPPQPPPAPTGCALAGTAICGLVGFTCNPFSFDTIVVSSGKIGVGVTSVEPRLGMINGTYLNEGRASVAVCAMRTGMTACGSPIDVTFGPILCPTPGVGHHPHNTCPTGQIPCGGGCGLPSDPECRLQ